MKGLIIKDICLMAQRKRFFAVMLVFVIMMNFNAGSDFASMWCMMIASIFVISTFAYDEYDNCYPFLMTLPLEKKDYALEKYCFGFIISAFALLVSLVISIGCCIVKGVSISEMFDSFSLTFLLFPLFVLDICIPINVKFGSDRGRLVLVLVFAAIACITTFIEREFPDYKIVMNAAFEELGTQTILIFLAIAALTLLSILLSMRIMEKKEF